MGERSLSKRDLGKEYSELTDLQRFKMRRFKGNIGTEDYYIRKKEGGWFTNNPDMPTGMDEDKLELLRVLRKMCGRGEM